MARLFLIDVQNGENREVECNGLDDYYKNIGCDTFDIARRQIGGIYYDIFCDDVGLLKEPQPPISAYDIKKHEPMLVGNLIIANHDREGNTTDLSDSDIRNIQKNLIFATSTNKPEGYVLLNCEY